MGARFVWRKGAMAEVLNLAAPLVEAKARQVQAVSKGTRFPDWTVALPPAVTRKARRPRAAVFTTRGRNRDRLLAGLFSARGG